VLTSVWIKYVFLGKELGARSEDTGLLRGRQSSIRTPCADDLFQLGLSRVQRGTEEYRLVLMCAEREPLACHRAILVAGTSQRVASPFSMFTQMVSLEDHDNALRRLAKILNLRENEHDFFRSRQDLFAEAYRLQEKRIAYDSNEALPTGIRAFKSAAG